MCAVRHHPGSRSERHKPAEVTGRQSLAHPPQQGCSQHRPPQLFPKERGCRFPGCKQSESPLPAAIAISCELGPSRGHPLSAGYQRSLRDRAFSFNAGSQPAPPGLAAAPAPQISAAPASPQLFPTRPARNRSRLGSRSPGASFLSPPENGSAARQLSAGGLSPSRRWRLGRYAVAFLWGGEGLPVPAGVPPPPRPCPQVQERRQGMAWLGGGSSPAGRRGRAPEAIRGSRGRERWGRGGNLRNGARPPGRVRGPIRGSAVYLS